MRYFYVYILRCGDGSYYIGHTDDMVERMHQHVSSTVGYTSSRKPIELVWQGEFETREGALAFEQRIKGWSRAKKEALIVGDWKRVRQLARSRNEVTSTPRLRQAQPERFGVDLEPQTVAIRSMVEAVTDGARLRQAQPERTRVGSEPETVGMRLKPVRPELVEGGAEPKFAPAGVFSPPVRPELVEGGGRAHEASFAFASFCGASSRCISTRGDV